MDDANDYSEPLVGDWAPWFGAQTPFQEDVNLDALSGKWVVLVFLGTTAAAGAQRALTTLKAFEPVFDADRARLLCITADPRDEGKVRNEFPGPDWLLDLDLTVAKSYGAASLSLDPRAGGNYRPRAFLLDPQLRVHAAAPIERLDEMMRLVERLPDPADHAGIEMHAPVLIIPRVLERTLCRRLIGLYESGPVEETGVTRRQHGGNDQRLVPEFKRRSDHFIVDRAMIAAITMRIERRVVAPIERAFLLTATHVERHIVSCYDSAHRAVFLPHRDNTSPGTAHRRFALSINLNEDFEGGELVFPEFGLRRYKAPAGAAVVFGCGLLHSVRPVTAERRFAYLPFLYDAAGAEILKEYHAAVG